MHLRLLLLLLIAAALPAQHSETALTNPFQTADDRARGGAFYRSQCASCHGFDGKGGASGPNLTAGSFRHASTDEGLFRIITKGLPGTSMPGFSMNGREIWQIVAFIRGFSANRTGGGASGNPIAGEQLFQSNGCLACHWLQGAGSATGLDLSDVGKRLTAAELRTALLDPSAEVAPEYWLWQATTNSGQKLRGSRLNEDTFSLQIMDHTGRLRSISKSDIHEQFLERRSTMPSFRDKLTPPQLNDLVAFLAKQQGVAK